ncbi:hypothetical protein HB779_11050 [Phyllobacterium sp. 628]|uniref:hypothetical protein n=1 Tax=Phyllobacterium sp. 628 TaxID=2718938 RepID=UPI00166269E8|nr:hypothetical protein [Phyllobacterium sp. 628]QND52383.1 hypothetical protein HB779_11050 [Phyllobacterium sp. 628]
MGFVITFPNSAMRQRIARKTEQRVAPAEIMIFPGVRYERTAKDVRTRDKDKSGKGLFDPMPQPS